MTTKRSMKKDEQAVSPVIAVIMLIAITVIIAAVVAAFAYGIIGGVKKAPSAALVVEGATIGINQPVKIFHHGGDPISGAFKNTGDGTGDDSIDDKMSYLEIRLNGAKIDRDVTSYAALNGNPLNTSWDVAFAPGDMLEVVFDNLEEENSLVILHTPSQNILQRITIS